jgi:DNA-binding transcriptional ArsR family regulator
MSINRAIPDYELIDRVVVTAPAHVRAIADPLRATILDLLQERAATVTELATAVHRPKSTIAYHVNVLVEAGVLRVVRTRRVRAIEERFYGRTARTFYIGAIDPAGEVDAPFCENDLSVAATESAPAHDADQLRSALRHARIPPERAAEFWDRVEELTREFSRLPRSGRTVFGFVVGLYPTKHPTLPEASAKRERVTPVRRRAAPSSGRGGSPDASPA